MPITRDQELQVEEYVSELDIDEELEEHEDMFTLVGVVTDKLQSELNIIPKDRYDLLLIVKHYLYEHK